MDSNHHRPVQSRTSCRLDDRAIAVELEGVEPSGHIVQGWPDAHIPTPILPQGIEPRSPVYQTGALTVELEESSGVIDGNCPRVPGVTTRCSVSLSYDHSAKGEICTLMPGRWLLRPVCLLFHHLRKIP